ncbi:MAG: polyprenyl synthetase family protein [Gammaproteobacteria bacterium AqS3]|nr:polyprenyl synthetase family protein [Gammaproteobacteria bacterium AqS3]
MNPRQFLPQIEARLKSILAEETQGSPLSEAMCYSVLGGGKRVRARLVWAAGALGEPHCEHDLAAAACAVELAHAYSLVHDDLPAMDDDDERRGQPACHVRFGEATAILTGNALQVLAFTQLTGMTEPALAMRAVRLLGEAIGSGGMAAGQQFDLHSDPGLLDAAEIERICWLKTGELIRASLLLGGLAGRCDPAALEILERFSRPYGLEYQIVDDLQDSQTDQTAPNYASVVGAEAARRRIGVLHAEAASTLDELPASGDALRTILAELPVSG